MPIAFIRKLGADSRSLKAPVAGRHHGERYNPRA